MIIDTALFSEYIKQYPYLALSASATLGGMASHPDKCANILVTVIKRTPLKHVVFYYWPQISAWFDLFQSEISKEVSKDKIEDAPEQPAAPPPAGAPKA